MFHQLHKVHLQILREDVLSQVRVTIGDHLQKHQEVINPEQGREGRTSIVALSQKPSTAKLNNFPTNLVN